MGQWRKGREERVRGVRVRVSSMARFRKGHSEETDGTNDWTAERTGVTSNVRQLKGIEGTRHGSLETVFMQPQWLSSLPGSLEPSITIVYNTIYC